MSFSWNLCRWSANLGATETFVEAECEKERNVGVAGGMEVSRGCAPVGGPDAGSDGRLGGDREHKNIRVVLGAEQGPEWGAGGSSLLGAEGGTVPFHALTPRQLVEHLPRGRDMVSSLAATLAVHLLPLGLAS